VCRGSITTWPSKRSRSAARNETLKDPVEESIGIDQAMRMRDASWHLHESDAHPARSGTLAARRQSVP